MQKLDDLVEMSELFHSVFFAFKMSLAYVIQTEKIAEVAHYMMQYLDLVFEEIPSFKMVKFRDVEKTLKEFAELIVGSGLAKEVAVERTEKGFNFNVKGCSFAGRVHHLLVENDVTCLYGILAFYLAEKSSGRRVVKAMSKFTSTDSHTPIEFLEKL